MDSTKEVKVSNRLIAPILFCFFVMGFVDVVGTAVSYIKDSLDLNATIAGLLPNFIFIWFLIFSIPGGLMMRKIGRKNTVQLSNIITAVGLFIALPIILGSKPSLWYYIPIFMLLGIGNTLLQIACNPLLSNVVEGSGLTRSITLGQFVKALSSLLGPQLALFSVKVLHDWNYIFIIYAVLTLASMFWLQATPIPKEQQDHSEKATFGKVMGLLGDKFILFMFLSILLIVGIDVGLNFFIPQIFKDVYHMKNPTSMNTVYFAARAIGSFVCALMLVKFSSKKVLTWTMICCIAAYIVMMLLAAFSGGGTASKVIFMLMFLPVGFATGNVFSIIFSFAIQHIPEKSDLISALLITGVAGGGFITLIMGALTDALGIIGGMAVLLLCMLYILTVAFYLKKQPDVV